MWAAGHGDSTKLYLLLQLRTSRNTLVICVPPLSWEPCGNKRAIVLHTTNGCIFIDRNST